ALLRPVTTTSNFGFQMDAGLDWRVFTYTFAAILFTGIFVGVWPAYRASGTSATGVMSAHRSDSGGSERQWARCFLMVGQVAGSVMLLIVAGLFVRSLGHAGQMHLGFDPDHLVTMMLDPQQVGYDEARSKTFYRDLESRVRALPGVQSASLSYATPMVYPGHAGPVFVEGRPSRSDQPPPMTQFNSVDSYYFETMRIPVLSGRSFRESDNDKSSPVAIVNRTLATKLWPGQDPVGQRFSIKSASGPFLEVVGIARDSQYFFLSSVSLPHFYVPIAQSFTTFQSLQVRSTAPPEAVIAGVQEQIRSLAPGLPIIDVRTMRAVVEGLSGLFIFRLAASLAALLGMLGLTLAVVGVYGVVSYSVSRRTQEIGIRMALGAGRGDVLKLALRQGVNLVIAGVFTGLAGAWGATRVMSKLLIGVSPSDPATYATVAVALSAVAMLACWIPARRATGVDPMVALRYE
ncbi:MAG TPA: FtsX-like permease family protein, partial [Bryobacteraceae bacterium]|nr:FtsX-like permease family protein [Bryobacteraceae bacterium]